MPLHSWYASHPADVDPPTLEERESVRLREAELIKPLEHAQGNGSLARLIVRWWQALWPSPSIFYALTLLALVKNRQTSLIYLLVTVSSAAILFLGSDFASAEIRYRLPVEPLFLIGASIGVQCILDLLPLPGRKPSGERPLPTQAASTD
jgi:hypothetical protein